MRLRNLDATVLVAFLLNAPAGAGGQAPESPAFEVVSIRPNKPSFDVMVLPDVVRLVGNRLQATNISALGLIHAAYGSEFTYRDQIIGADGWITSARFDVEAHAASALAEKPTSTPLPTTAALMLQRALQDRFQLRVRREVREIPRLVLVYARAARSLKQGIRTSNQDCTGVAFGTDAKCEYLPDAGSFRMRGRPLKTFVDYLSRPAYAGGAVIDETGITGMVDIDFTWALDFKDLLSSRASLLTALQEQLGLKLENRRIPMTVLVIERIQRPSAN